LDPIFYRHHGRGLVVEQRRFIERSTNNDWRWGRPNVDALALFFGDQEGRVAAVARQAQRHPAEV
jgi:hypothetical protein